MATFKAEIQSHQPRKDGTYNIKIRVTHNRRKKYLPTSLYISKAELTTRYLKIKDTAFIDATNEIVKKYRTICNNAGDSLSSMSVE